MLNAHVLHMNVQLLKDYSFSIDLLLYLAEKSDEFLDGFPGEFYKTCKGEIILILYHLF